MTTLEELVQRFVTVNVRHDPTDPVCVAANRALLDSVTQPMPRDIADLARWHELETRMMAAFGELIDVATRVAAVAAHNEVTYGRTPTGTGRARMTEILEQVIASWTDHSRFN